jgi:hypothetical protein
MIEPDGIVWPAPAVVLHRPVGTSVKAGARPPPAPAPTAATLTLSKQRTAARAVALAQPKVGVEDGVRDCAGVGAMVAAGDRDADALELAGGAAEVVAVAVEVAVELAVDVDDEVEDAVLDGCGAHAASAQASSSERRTGAHMLQRFKISRTTRK